MCLSHFTKTLSSKLYVKLCSEMVTKFWEHFYLLGIENSMSDLFVNSNVIIHVYTSDYHQTDEI